MKVTILDKSRKDVNETGSHCHIMIGHKIKVDGINKFKVDKKLK